MKPLNILVIPGYKLFPIDSGGAHYQLVFLDKQQYQHSIDMIVTPKNVAIENLKELKEKFPAVSFITVGYNKKSFFSKWISFFKKQYGKLRQKQFPYTLKKIKHLQNLRPNDIDLIEEIRQLISRKQYDVIQAEHTVNLGLIEIFPKDLVRIFVHHEISHTRIKSDLLATGHNQIGADRISSVAKGIEINWLNKYDGVITLSREDKELLVSNGVNMPVLVSQPFVYFNDELNKIYEESQQPGLIFLGGESHFPNKEGLSWFLQEVYPLVRQTISRIRILITGNWTEAFKNKYPDPTIQFTGYVKDLKSVLKTGVLIIPIRIGSGIRVKAITAFGYGIPVVSTSFAVAGIPGLEHNKNILLADDANQFAKSIIALLHDPVMRKKISDQIFELAATEYEKGSFAEQRNMFYQQFINSKRRS